MRALVTGGRRSSAILTFPGCLNILIDERFKHHGDLRVAVLSTVVQSAQVSAICRVTTDSGNLPADCVLWWLKTAT